jgi:toxin ParE1/3/4
MLAEGVRSGRMMPDLKRNYLALSFRSHVVIYRQTDTHLTIIRILHQRMNVRRHL